MKRILWVTIGLLASVWAISASAYDYDPLFHSTDVLAARDGDGKLHQGPWLNPTDFEPRYGLRAFYYLESGASLVTKPGYVGALQAALRRKGYYCGPIDGIYTSEVSDAIARMQKNYSMRVTATLTIPVRRALFLP